MIPYSLRRRNLRGTELLGGGNGPCRNRMILDHPCEATINGGSGLRSSSAARRVGLKRCSLVGIPRLGFSAGTGSSQPREVPRRLHVPVDRGRVTRLEIAICDFKLGRSTPGATVRFHRTGRGDAVQRAAQPARGPGQRRDNADLRAPAVDTSRQCWPRSSAG